MSFHSFKAAQTNEFSKWHIAQRLQYLLHQRYALVANFHKAGTFNIDREEIDVPEAIH
jgi:hypothetical protein